ncbi:S46 family peptidase [Terricaulis sp.]|uniref:S46 family peptidase n=1 Tax=Terricaulis sp. TaxID=2768686 RepID=UPI0037847D07
MHSWMRALAAALTCFAFASTPAQGEEGMWTFDNFPAARMRQQMGWAPDQAWLDRVMVGTARLPGCSGSNVSAEGLMLTNHHCAIACIRALSTAEQDFLADGFMARTRAEERRCAGMSILLLQGVTDVTARIEAATAGAAPDAFAQTRDAEIVRIRATCPRGFACEVVTLYGGARFALYRYKRYDDVRLVFAPEHAMAALGGEADNFNFPRYCLDVAFLRLYQDGAPVETPRHLRMRWTPIEADEIALVAGNPGATSRLLTTGELTFQRDFVLPWRLESLRAARARLQRFEALSPDNARTVADVLQTTENSLKMYEGRLAALRDQASFQRAAAAETDLRARVARNQAATREVGDAWGETQRAETAYRSFFYQHQYLEAGAGAGSEFFTWARDLVRGADERTKPNAERLARYSDARIGLVEQSLRADRPVDRALEQVNLAIWLDGMRARLGRDPVVQRVLGGASAEELAAYLSQSQLDDPQVRMDLWRGGAPAIAASTDPMITFVRSWDAEARAVRARYVRDVETPVALAHERIARARFRAFGDAHYPDATFTPRLSYGRIAGWSDSGQTVEPFTRLSGLFARPGVTQRWISARPTLDEATLYNVTSSNDIISGNSGSPLLDREGDVIGVAFDGNLHSLGGEYFYDGGLNRMVSVTSAAMRTALVNVYGMDALVAEMDR